MDRAETCGLRLGEELSPDWPDWMNGMTMQHVSGETVLTGWIRDQAELHGLLVKVHDLGLSIVALRRIGDATQEERA